VFLHLFFLLSIRNSPKNSMLKDAFFFLPRSGQKGPFCPFWYREASFYPILTLIGYIFQKLPVVFKKVEVEVGQLHFEVFSTSSRYSGLYGLSSIRTILFQGKQTNCDNFLKVSYLSLHQPFQVLKNN